MKLLVFAPYYPPHIGGLETYADELNRRLAEEGYEVLVVAPLLPSNLPGSESAANNLEILRFPAFEIISSYPLPKFWKPLFWRQMGFVFRKDFDVIFSHTRFFLVSSLLAFTYAKMKRKPWLHIEHGSDFVQLTNKAYSSVARIYDLTLGRFALRRADHVVAISKAAKDFVERLAPSAKTTVVYRGFDFEKIDAVEAVRQGNKKEKMELVFIGRLISSKGPSDLLKAVSYIKDAKFRLLIIGDGPERQNLEKLSEELSFTDKIEFLGALPWPETISILKSADIFINPSYTEGLPTTVIEAALCRTAIVATNVGGTPEIITDGESGFLVEPRKPEKLAEKIMMLIQNEDLRLMFGITAERRTRGLLDWKKCVTIYTDINKKLAER